MISEHISEKEATKSVTAIRLGIANTPDGNILSNMKSLAINLFEPLRKWVGGPIKINSFYRSEVHQRTENKHLNIVKVRRWILMIYMGIKQTPKCFII